MAGPAVAGTGAAVRDMVELFAQRWPAAEVIVRPSRVQGDGAAEEVAGVHFDPTERELMLDGLKQQEQRIEALHKIPLDNSVGPAIVFDPLPPGKKIPQDARRPMVKSQPVSRQSGEQSCSVMLSPSVLPRLLRGRLVLRRPAAAR